MILNYFLFEDQNANDPFITMSPFDILTSQSYESNIDTLYSSSPKVCTFPTPTYVSICLNILFLFKEFVSSEERKQPELLKNFDDMFEIGFPLEMAHIDFESEVRDMQETKNL